MSDEREVVVVEHKPGEEKPWHVSLEGAGFFDTGRAKLNFPKRDFDTQEEAEEVAEKIRDLIKSDAVEVRGEEKDASSADYAGVAAPPLAGAAGVGASSTSTTWDEGATSTTDTATGRVDEAPAVTDENILSGVPDREPLVEDDVLVDPDDNQVEVGTYGDVAVDEEESPVISLVDDEPVVVPAVPVETSDETVGVESVPPEHVNEPEHSAEVGGLEDPVFDPIPEDLPGESEGERESELRRENLM